MKDCAICHHKEADEAPTCTRCGEASWLAPAPPPPTLESEVDESEPEPDAELVEPAEPVELAPKKRRPR